MMSTFLSRVVILVFGALYPAYISYKVVRGKRLRDYVKWTMYWIVFALFLWTETLADLLLFWLPFYYELKIIFVLWLLSPYTRGASLLYRNFVHPALTRNEAMIDDWLDRAVESSMKTALDFGSRALLHGRTVATSALLKGQEHLANQLRHYYALNEKLLAESGQGMFGDLVPDSAPLSGRAVAIGESPETERVWQGFYTDDGSIVEHEFQTTCSKPPSLPQNNKQRWPNYGTGTLGCLVE